MISARAFIHLSCMDGDGRDERSLLADRSDLRILPIRARGQGSAGGQALTVVRTVTLTGTAHYFYYYYSLRRLTTILRPCNSPRLAVFNGFAAH